MKGTISGVLLALACLHAALSAVAQPPRAAPSEELGTSEGEAAVIADGAAEPADAAAKARERFAQGTRWARQGNWLEAVAAYESAHQLYPHATTFYNIGFCQMKLGDLVAAWQSTARALDPGAHDPARQLSPERRLVAERQRESLRERLSSVTVLGPPGLSIHVGDFPLVDAGVAEPGSFVTDRNPEGGGARTITPRTRIYLNPGRYSISIAMETLLQRYTVSLTEGAHVTRQWIAAPTTAPDPSDEVRSPAGSSSPVPASSSPVPAKGPAPTRSRHSDADSSSAIQTAKLGSLLVAAGGFGLAVTSGIVALSTSAHLDSVCPAPKACPRAERGRVERYRTSVKLTNAGLVTALAASTVGLSLTLFGKDERQPSTSVSAMLSGVELVHDF